MLSIKLKKNGVSTIPPTLQNIIRKMSPNQFESVHRALYSELGIQYVSFLQNENHEKIKNMRPEEFERFYDSLSTKIRKLIKNLEGVPEAPPPPPYPQRMEAGFGVKRLNPNAPKSRGVWGSCEAPGAVLTMSELFATPDCELGRWNRRRTFF